MICLENILDIMMNGISNRCILLWLVVDAVSNG